MMCQQKASPFLTSPSSSSSSTPQSQWHQKPPPQNCAAAAIQPPTAPEFLSDAISLYHTHEAGPNQCCSTVVQPVNAPLDSVWSVVRRFDAPQVYKHFIRSCSLLTDGDACSVGALREVRVVSGLPAATSTERLDVLDDDRHVIGFSIVGGDHRLTNYHSVTSIHSDPAGAAAAGSERTFIVESYVVDVPPGNTKEETCVFVDTIVRCNLQSLAHVSENQSRSARRKNPQNN